MLRFMPTSSGKYLHYGHLGSLCVINTISKKYREKTAFIIDDLQIRNWNLYDKNYSFDEINESKNNITKTVNYLFPEMEDLGSFSDDKYEEDRLYFYDNQENIEIIESGPFLYAVLKDQLIKTLNGNYIFDSLKSFYKINKHSIKKQYSMWNPFYSHELIDKSINTTIQIVDNNLYHHQSYLIDNHVNCFDLFGYWGKVIKRQDYGIITHCRVCDYMGNEIHKSDLDSDYFISDLSKDIWHKAAYLYDVDFVNVIENISSKILNNGLNSLRLRKA